MNRTRWLLLVVLVLGLGNLTANWWRGRGLITIHSDNSPASRVIRDIERQGGLAIKTNVPADFPVRMHVDKVPLAEALETLATVVEGRWRLAYLFAPSQGEIQNALGAFTSGERPETWQQLFYPLPPIGEDAGGPPPDPRGDPWQVKPAEKGEFQAYAEQAARSVSAVMAFPKEWNPPISTAPASGAISKVAPRLAKAAGGRVLEVVLLEKRGGDFSRAPGNRESASPGDGGPRLRRPEGDGADEDQRRQAMAERAQAEIEKLPPEKRAAAQAQWDERRKFMEGMRDLTPEQRRDKIAELLSRPDTQDRFEQRMSEQMARMTPDQRVERASRYIQNKEQARSGATNR